MRGAVFVGDKEAVFGHQFDNMGAGIGQFESAQNITFQPGTSVGETTVEFVVGFFL